ncbi:ROK family transcriptional regulator [Rhodoblastus sp.]|uniref:ROK family transcriptional regulator n=1 Tax=Rhodoblastus sp. TaxID=1962975 RepID=UPI0035AFA34E
MIFDAAATPQTGEKSRGTNLIGVRAYNERLVLSLVRRFSNLPKAEIARLTGLSAQTASVIVRALEGDGLLLRMEPNRGRVGQPSVPLRLNPDGAYAVGLHIGRRTASLMLMDFVGAVRDQVRCSYAYPDVDNILAFTAKSMAALTDKLSDTQKERIAGLGVAVPFELWSWCAEVGAPHSALEAWRNCNLLAELESVSGLSVSISNDATAACGAELTFGRGRDFEDFLYFFVGYFAGGGIVLNGELYSGRQGNAGALGSMPVVIKDRKTGVAERRQLIHAASLYGLERRLIEAGRDPVAFFRSQAWDSLGPILDDWLDEASDGLAQAIAASVSVIDFGHVIIDGGLAPDVRRRLVDLVRKKARAQDLQGLSPFEIDEGSIGANARTMGAASLPFFARFLLNQNVLFKGEA